ncbi:tetratricopeptide repeat protein [Occallatibacter savannae]|uniref:tetratricopeptide repeat protein n=1 Tax=Occallatibacter savannae TaxID=1002691 RepID=UPI000D69EBCF|nr:tetratricopeptide repeat protein [Occallatibacter savannae]
MCAFAQTSACKPIGPHSLSPAEKAYSDGYYAQAQELFAQALQQNPTDAVLAAKDIAALLHLDKIADAMQALNAAVAANPNSAAVLTAQAEVQIRRGQPWLAEKSLNAAAAADPCYARVHLIRSRLFRIESMYASERTELEKAYALDVTDPDILMAWSHIIPPALEVEGTVKALEGPDKIDEETRAKAEATVHSILPVLREDSQTCKVLPTAPSATLPLLPTRDDGKHIDGFRVEVKFPKSTARLTLDTGASGLFISKAIADLNGFARGMGAPMDTVRAESVQIGPLEFHDCIVGVSELPFPGGSDGFIGTDILASYLITIDPRAQKLQLDPLPKQSGALPGDRSASGELAGYQPVYHRRQYLLVPVTLDGKVEKLFALDTGMRMSAMSPETAHAASDTKMNFTNTLQTKSGAPVQVYRDNFDLQFAGMSMERQSRILSMEPSAIAHNTGFDVGGLLGFDVLGQLTTHLDYRDGLVKFESPEAAASSGKNKGTEKAREEAECPSYASAEIPLDQTLQLKVMGTLDSAHLKPGKEIWAKVVNGLMYPGCTLDRDAIVYAHVTAASASTGPAELGLAFDHADCAGRSKAPMTFHLIALLPPPDQSKSLHSALPTQVAGGAVQISDTAAATDGYDALLSDGGKPNTVHPGVVVKMPGVKLEPLGGPGCSARITSASRSVQLAPGAEFILALSSSAQNGKP